MFDEPRDEYDCDILSTTADLPWLYRSKVMKGVLFPLWILPYVAEKIYRIFKPLPNFEDVYKD